MPRPRRVPVALAVVLLAALALQAVAAAQPPTTGAPPVSEAPTTGDDTATAGTDVSAVVAPLSARFESPDGPPELAATQFSVEAAPDDDVAIWVVRFGTGFPLPADGYRVAVVAGDPNGERVRASMVVEGGAPTGVVERGDGQVWERVGTVGAFFDPAGVVRIESPAEAPFTDPGPATAAWVFVEIPGGQSFVSPLYAAAQLRSGGDAGALGVAPWGTVTDSAFLPTGEWFEGAGGPSIAVDGDQAVITSTEAPPTDLRGNPVVGTVDYVRLGPQSPTGGLPPFFVAIDQTNRTVVLWDASGGIPRPVETGQEAWLVAGLAPAPPGGAPPGPSEVVLDLDGLAATLGYGADDPTVGLGIARTFALVDGRYVTYDGAMGLEAWFTGATDPTLAPLEEDVDALAPEATDADEDEGGSSSAAWIVLAIVALAALVAAVVWYVRRRSGEEAHEDHNDLPEARRSTAAGVSPDDALAALSRTVDEVSSKLDRGSSERSRLLTPKPVDAATPGDRDGGPAAGDAHPDAGGRPGGAARTGPEAGRDAEPGDAEPGDGGRRPAPPGGQEATDPVDGGPGASAALSAPVAEGTSRLVGSAAAVTTAAAPVGPRPPATARPPGTTATGSVGARPTAAAPRTPSATSSGPDARSWRVAPDGPAASAPVAPPASTATDAPSVPDGPDERAPGRLRRLLRPRRSEPAGGTSPAPPAPDPAPLPRRPAERATPAPSRSSRSSRPGRESASPINIDLTVLPEETSSAGDELQQRLSEIFEQHTPPAGPPNTARRGGRAEPPPS